MSNRADILRQIIAWHARVQDREYERGSPAGINYQNGDSDKHPGNAWDDLDAIVRRAKAALR